MDNSPLKKLKEAAHHAATSETRMEKATKLAEAFELFSLETARLEKSYTSLQQEFEEVNRKLHQATHHLEHLLDNIQQGFIYIQSDGAVAMINRAAENLLHLEAEKDVGNHYSAIFSDEYFGFSIQQSLQGKKPPKRTIIHFHPPKKELDEKVIDIESTRLEEGGLILLLRDISKLYELQMIAVKDDRLKTLGEITSIIAHDLRNPLTAIRGYADLLYKDLVHHPKEQSLAGLIVQGMDEINTMLENILNYASKPQMIKETVDLVQLCERVAGDYGNIALELPSGPILYLTDPVLIQSILHNLLANASQALDESRKGNISLQLQEQKNHVTLTVRDNGVGIPENKIKKIFQPHFTTKKEGHGIGLAGVKRLVDYLLGEIRVESIVDKGTTFTITLPRMYDY